MRLDELKSDPRKKCDFSGKNLTTLAGLPIGREVEFFNCSNNHLTSLKGAPQKVLGEFECYSNKLTSLEWAPREVLGSFICVSNKITSLKGIHEQIRRIGRVFDARMNPIESCVLGLLLIEGVIDIYLDDDRVVDILSRHVGKGRIGVARAQKELIDAGLHAFAEV